MTCPCPEELDNCHSNTEYTGLLGHEIMLIGETVTAVYKLLDYLNVYKHCCVNNKYCSKRLLDPKYR